MGKAVTFREQSYDNLEKKMHYYKVSYKCYEMLSLLSEKRNNCIADKQDKRQIPEN
jgi:hypothetical protein